MTQETIARPTKNATNPKPPRGPAGNSATVETIPAHAPGVCPVCGGRTLAPEGASSALLAVCDVLAVTVLERIGKRIMRNGRDRARFALLGSRPFFIAHTIWPASDEYVTRALHGAWDVVPALLDTHGCCGVTSIQVTRMLDDYIHDLVLTGTEHCIGELAYRFESRLGLPVYLNGHHHADT